MPHVLGDVLAENVVPVHISAQALLLSIVTGEPFLGVGDVDAAIGGALHGPEDPGTGGGAGKTGVQTGREGAGALVLIVDDKVFAIDLGLSLVDRVQVELLQDLQ